MSVMWLDSLITESALKFIIRLKRARGMAQWVKAHVAKPEFHPWDAYSVGREPMPTSHRLASTCTLTYTYQINECKKLF